MKVFHILYQSFPNISGSSTRSAALLQAQLGAGMGVVVLTSPFQNGLDVSEGVERIDGIDYYRCYRGRPELEVAKDKSIWLRFKKLFSLFSFMELALAVAAEEKPAIIHSHATFYCAIAGAYAARELGVPHVYEVRSDWVNNSNFKAGRVLRWLAARAEAWVIKRAAAVVVISRGLHLKYRSTAKLITLVPNAVPAQLLARGAAIEPRYSQGPLRLAYIGSLIDLEGLDFVLEALAKLDQSQFSLAVVGEGKAKPRLESLAQSLGLGNVQFLGRQPPAAIPDFYPYVDVVVNYRRDEPVAHSVTPLKPLEAMAMKTLVLVSDVGGMTELVEHGVTGVVVSPNDPQALAQTLAQMRLHMDACLPLVAQAYDYVVAERSWQKNVQRYQELYAKLLN
ncbi:MAG: glycosyltransferase family 4 protein [Cellvibrionaceae bacterium]|nr:glycosyltransferase family 4 protein [Cellvibrionaceae bacterium]MCV6627136.1 glycosyltransferase family 4 protein [Cellvibrionaceae bacterium]